MFAWMPGMGKSSDKATDHAPDSRTSFFRGPSIFGGGGADNHPVMKSDRVFVKRIKAVMYSFGSPRVGNSSFAQMYDRMVPSTFRVVVDGDVVVALPPSTCGYVHIGTEILIDSLASGSIIIDPSFVERWLRTHVKSSVASHSLLVYRKSILGLKLAAEYVKRCVEDQNYGDTDPLKVAMRIQTNMEFSKLVEEQVNILDSKPIDIARFNESESDVSSIAEVDGVILRDMSIAPPSIRNTSMTSHVSQSRDLEARHYERDKENMEELMKQMEGTKRFGWI